jgi:cyclohexa-1,5-dienecarbonyl-CoA hydratase
VTKVPDPVAITASRDEARQQLVFHHPPGNIVTMEIIDAMRARLAELRRVPQLRMVTIEGAGSDFSFGASVEEHAPGRIEAALPLMHRLIGDLLDLPAVTAALVRGRCLGGGFEIALACDFIFAAEDAVLGLPEIALGVFPPAATVLLPPRVGLTRAARAIFTGEASPAREWRDAGLIEFVVPEAGLQAEVERWYNRHLAPRSAASLRHAAGAVRLALRQRARQWLPRLERMYLKQLMTTHDAAEGIAAFLEKRAPEWTDS